MKKQSASNVVELKARARSTMAGERLQREATRILENAVRHREGLRAKGYTAEDESRLRESIAGLDRANAERRAAREKAKQATRRVTSLVAEVNELHARAVTAFRLAGDELGRAGPLFATVGRPMGPARARAWLVEVNPYLSSLRAPLGRHLRDELRRSPELQAELISTLEARAAAASAIPPLTVDVRRWHAGVLRGIDRAHLVARLAFRREPGVLRQFKKNLSPPRRRTHEVQEDQPLPKTA